jgi:hypothetical protein
MCPNFLLVPLNAGNLTYVPALPHCFFFARVRARSHFADPTRTPTAVLLTD